MTVLVEPWPGLGWGFGSLSLSLVSLLPTGPECASSTRLPHSSAPQGLGAEPGVVGMVGVCDGQRCSQSLGAQWEADQD